MILTLRQSGRLGWGRSPTSKWLSHCPVRGPWKWAELCAELPQYPENTGEDMGSGRVCRQQITPLSTRPTDSQGWIFMVFLPLHLLLRSSFSPKFPKHVPFAVAQPSMIFFLLFPFLLMPSCQHISSLIAVPSSLESEWCEFNVMISCRGNISGKEKRNYISLLHTTFH